MSKVWQYRPYIILILFSILLVLMTLFFRSESLKITIESPKTLNHGWIYQGDTLPELPYQLDMNQIEPYEITILLPESFAMRQVMMIRTSLSDVIVRLDGVIIYEKSFEEGGLPPYASMWHFVELPGHSNGKALSLTFYSPYQNMAGTLNAVFYGSNASLLQYQFQTYGIRLIIGIFVFIVGLLIMVVSLFSDKTSQKGFSYVGLFAVLLALWMIAESRMIQWITGSQLIIGSLAYLVLPLFPIPLAIYLKKHVMKLYKKPFDYLMILYTLQFFIVIGFQIFDIYDFFETLSISILLITIGIITAVTFLILEIKQVTNQEAMTFIKMFIFLIVFGLLEFINVLLNNYAYTSTFLLIGIAILALLILINYGRFMIQRYKMSYEKEIYEKLAYDDRLTGAKNRLAYEQDFEKLFDDKKVVDQLQLIYLDFDDLKTVNDIYGHLEGDEVLKRGYEIIKETFGSYGECYRIGGDEFACLLIDDHQNIIESQVPIFEERMTHLSQKMGYNFRVSLGYTSHKASDLKPSDMVKRADDHMYLNKCTYKGNCKRIIKELKEQ
jgi:diguanylate cyclase (GGDEF)-like protein